MQTLKVGFRDRVFANRVAKVTQASDTSRRNRTASDSKRELVMPVKSLLLLIADLDLERYTILGPTCDVETVQRKVCREQVAGRHVRCEPVPSHLSKDDAIVEYGRLHPDMRYVDDALVAA